MITVDDARKIVARYYAGETVRDEIAMLEQFFACAESLPDDLVQEAKLFGLIQAARDGVMDTPVPDGLYESLEAIVDAKSQESRRPFPRLRLWIMSVAAMVAVLIAVGGALLSGFDMTRDGEMVARTVYDDEVTDPQRAAEVTRMALAELTCGLRKAKASVHQTGRDIDRVNEQINRIMKKI